MEGISKVLSNIRTINCKWQKGTDQVSVTWPKKKPYCSKLAYLLFHFLEPSKPVVKFSDDPKTIEAQDRSPITLTIGDNVTALTNTSITIQCPTSGVPKPSVTWTRDGQEIPSGGRYTVQDDGSLVIREADEDDSARYTCTADSVAGKDSASSNVWVLGESPLAKIRSNKKF